MINIQSNISDCVHKCVSNTNCSHFSYNDGTCYIKSGIVSKSDAVYTGDYSMICGISSSKY